MTTSIFNSSSADLRCEEVFEDLDNVDDVLCSTEQLSNGEQ